MKDSPNPGMCAPREVYLSGCAEIGSALSAQGYGYLKSGPKLRRRVDPFTFEISFQSSHANQPGRLAALWVHGYVFSSVLKKWRAANPSLVKGTGFVAGGQIGNLVPDVGWLEWNLMREGEAAEALRAIRRIVLPYFSLFEDVAGLHRRLLAEPLPGCSPANALDFLFCTGGRDMALEAAYNMLERLPGARQGYRTALEKFRADGLPVQPAGGYGGALAAAVITFGLPDLLRYA